MCNQTATALGAAPGGSEDASTATHSVAFAFAKRAGAAPAPASKRQRVAPSHPGGAGEAAGVGEAGGSAVSPARRFLNVVATWCGDVAAPPYNATWQGCAADLQFMGGPEPIPGHQVGLACQDCNVALHLLGDMQAALPATLAPSAAAEAAKELDDIRSNLLQLCRHLARCAVQRAGVEQALAEVAADGSGESAVLVLDFKVGVTARWGRTRGHRVPACVRLGCPPRFTTPCGPGACMCYRTR